MTDHLRPAAALDDLSPGPAAARTVLLVDDESSVRRSAGRLLERAGYRVITAEDGADALDRVEQLAGGVDVVVTDMIMPRMDARELALVLRRRWPEIPVVLSTGFAAGRLDDGGTALFDRFVPKPYTPDELVSAVRASLEGRA